MFFSWAQDVGTGPTRNREAPKTDAPQWTETQEGGGLRGHRPAHALTYDTEDRQIAGPTQALRGWSGVSPVTGLSKGDTHATLNYPLQHMVSTTEPLLLLRLEGDGVIAVNKDTSKFTDEFLPDQRSHLYGLTIATTNCLSGSH
ncbi:unnamed protein product [Boreogadus saida]